MVVVYGLWVLGSGEEPRMWFYLPFIQPLSQAQRPARANIGPRPKCPCQWRVQASALGVPDPGRAHVPRGGRVGHGMQLHRQLPELREGGPRRGEDLSDLQVGQHYRGQRYGEPRAGPPRPLAPPRARFPPASRRPNPIPGGKGASELAGDGRGQPVAARERCPQGRSNLGGR